jgi:hypothetical protein
MYKNSVQGWHAFSQLAVVTFSVTFYGKLGNRLPEDNDNLIVAQIGNGPPIPLYVN